MSQLWSVLQAFYVCSCRFNELSTCVKCCDDRSLYTENTSQVRSSYHVWRLVASSITSWNPFKFVYTPAGGAVSRQLVILSRGVQQRSCLHRVWRHVASGASSSSVVESKWKSSNSFKFSRQASAARSQ